MRRNAIIRIIIYCILIVVLLGILLGGIGLQTYVWHFDTTHEVVSMGNGQVNASEVRKLNIEWASGDITIESGDTDTITFSESGAAPEDRKMAYSLEEGRLNIYYEEPSSYIGIHNGSYADKHLTITVPEDWVCQELSVDSASTDAVIQGLVIQNVDLDSASNEFRFENCQVESLDIDGASNKVILNGTLSYLDCDGMSCDLIFNLMNTPESLDLDGMSTALDLTLPADTGFQVNMDGLSNQFHSDFDVSYSDDCYTYGNRLLKIDVDGMSSTVTIRKGE